MKPETCTAMDYPWGGVGEEYDQPLPEYVAGFASFAEHVSPHTGRLTGRIIDGGDTPCEKERGE